MEIDSIKLEDDQTYLLHKQNLQRTRARIAATEKEISERAAKAASVSVASPLEQTAARLLAGQEPGDLSISEDRDQEIRQKTIFLRFLREAERQGKEKLEKARQAASEKIMVRIVPEYRDTVQIPLQAAIEEVARLSDREAEYRDKLFQEDIAYAGSMRVMPCDKVGSLKDPYSYTNMRRRELDEHYFNGNGKPAKPEPKPSKKPVTRIQLTSNYASPSGFVANVGDVIDVGEVHGRELIAAGAATPYLGSESNLVPVRDKVWSIKKKAKGGRT